MAERTYRRSLRGPLLAFLFLNFIDLWLTWRLLNAEGSLVYEANPAARWCLDFGGWWGLAAFKAGVVCLASATMLAVGKLRPFLGRRLITVACLPVGAVVLYSVMVPQLFGVLPNGATIHQERELARDKVLTAATAQLWSHLSLKQQLVGDVVARRRTFPEIIDILVRAEQGMPANRLHHLRRLYSGRSDRECLAATFTSFAVAQVRTNVPLSLRVRRELHEAYRRYFGSPVPAPWGKPAAHPQSLDASQSVRSSH